MVARLFPNIIKLIAVSAIINISFVSLTFAEDSKLATVQSVEYIDSEHSTILSVKSDKSIVSTIYDLPAPDRIVLDMADAVLAKDFSENNKVKSIQMNRYELKESQPIILRFEFILQDKLPYETTKTNNEIKLVLSKKESSKGQDEDQKIVGQANQSRAESGSVVTPAEDKSHQSSPPKDKIGSVIGISKNLDQQLPDINPLEAKLSPKAKAQQMEDAFNFSGYNKERITVEFQKMDLHNVFNFLRQVSGVNIVVDESVQGALTLVLDDVPWDFALDIILNLKDLEKEERFNTIVIYPKNKGFRWPEQAQNNLSFQADSKVIEQESLIIRQQDFRPVESPEAREFIVQGRKAEQQGNVETAVQLYEQAFEKWPTNSKLAERISLLYLVNLRQNAKALYYAKLALEKDKQNSSAMLNAAIAAANMNDKQSARMYFNQSVQVKKPLKEAFVNFAAFNENNNDLALALQNIERHDALYGADMDTMLAAARIYDRMGKSTQANERYQKVLLSGFSVPPDLENYIKSRLSDKQMM